MKVLVRIDDILPPRRGGYRSGVGRSNMELLKGFSKCKDIDFDIETYCLGFSQPSYKGNDLDFKYHRYILPHVINKYCGIESLWRRHVIGYDLFHLTGNFDRVDPSERFLVTIHDLYMYSLSSWNRKMFENCALNSLGIVTCSEYTKQDIVKTLGVKPDKISVIPWGISTDLFYERSMQEIKMVKEKYNIQSDYFFACSCAHPRKNAIYILKGFRLALKDNPNIVLVMSWGNVPSEIIKEYSNEIQMGRIIFLDYVSDEDLATLYSGALASFLVSSLEGFGFPILESMACGTPSITCRNSSLEEIGSDKAFYVREKNAEDIAEAILFFSSKEKDTSEELVDYSRKFSWEATAKSYLKLYRKYL